MKYKLIPQYLLVIVFCLSCSITHKRYFHNYHANWNRSSNKEVENNEIRDQLLMSSNEETIPVFFQEKNLQETNDSLKSNDTVSFAKSPKEKIKNLSKDPHHSKTEKGWDNKVRKKINDKKNSKSKDVANTPKIHPYTWWTLIFTLLTIIMAVVIVWLLIFGLEVLGFVGLLLLMGLMGTVSIGLASVAITDIMADKSKYRARGFTWTVFALSLFLNLLPFLVLIGMMIFLLIQW
jgi:hypothetical protein